MKQRNNIITSIFKSDDPEKLIVFHASSLPNEIRFYLNDTQYFTAVETEEGCSFMLAEEKEKRNKKSSNSIIKEKLREFIKIFSIIIGISILSFIGVIYLSTIIDSILLYLIIINIIYFVIDIANVVIIENMISPPEIKSKHSAEHMMVNFIEINKRLPKSVEEVKKYSRFSQNCGSRKQIDGITEKLISSIVATIVTVIVGIIISHFSSNSLAYAIVFLSTYFLIKFVVGKAITKYGALTFIIQPIKRVLTNIVQCANTTSKVKDRDIMLAYFAAKPWLREVYPEFYNENEDIFWKKYVKVNN